MALGRPRRERLAAGLGGYAPDLDVLTSWIGLVAPSLYFLGHRGFSHSLLGAPLHAAALVLVLAIPFWRRRFPRMEALRLSGRTLAIAMVASWSHLFLDFLTMWGIPWLFPWDASRPSLNWYFYSAWSAMAVGAYACWRMARGRADDRFLGRAAVALVAVLLTVGAVRLGTRPAVEEGEVAQPGPWEWQWTLLQPVEGGWDATFYSWREAGDRVFYPSEAVLPPDEAEAVARAKESIPYKRFHLYAGGPETVVVDPAGAGAWNVTFVDLMRKAQIDRSGGLFASLDRSALRLVVDAGGVREIE